MEKKNAILVWVDNEQRILNESIMTYEEAYKLMEIRAVSHWLSCKNASVKVDEETIKSVSHCSGIYIASYSASVWVNPENTYSWKIILI